MPASKRINEFKKSVLSNGTTLVTERLPQFQALSLGVWVSAGTRHESKGEEGLSHFLEHMMFKGTGDRSALEIALAVDRVGGEFNAFTAREYTCFHLLMLSRDIKLAVEIMADVMLNSKFAEDEIERERKVILQEVLMVEDSPEELVHDLFFDYAFDGHPLGKPILGSAKTIGAFDRETLVSYYRKHYAPSQLVISVAGDVRHEEVKRLLERQLAGLVGGGKRVSKPNMHRPQPVSGLKHVSRDLEQAHLVLGFPSVSNADPNRFAAYLLNIYLGGGMSSSLFQEIREKRGLAYTVYSSLAPFSDSGLFSVYVGTSPNEVQTCADVMGAEIVKLRDRTLDKAALEILKDNLKGTILLNSDSVENRMTAIARNELFFGRHYPMAETTKLIENVTVEDVRRVARKLFRKDKLVFLTMGPNATSSARKKLLAHF